MRFIDLTLVALCLASSMGSARGAGSVDVTFVKPELYSDAGDPGTSRERNLSAISQQLQRLGATRLADGQTLAIQVLNLDLAGETRPARRGGLVRVLSGGADWPRVELRYSLSANGQVLQSGEESVVDMNYLRHVASHPSYAGALPYETRMLETWFKARFGEK